ncbi:hypothetical protein H8E77_14445, partial [bacterium]|nr:hypothetical protein [bacterium]
MGNREVDNLTSTHINQLYIGHGFAGRPPDTSEVAVNPNVTEIGLLLIGELDLERMENEYRDKNGFVTREVVKSWKCGYWFFDIVSESLPPQFQNCIYTTNQNVMAAMVEYFNVIKADPNTVEWQLSTRMTPDQREQILEQIKERITASIYTRASHRIDFEVDLQKIQRFLTTPQKLISWFCDDIEKNVDDPDEEHFYNLHWEQGHKSKVRFDEIDNRGSIALIAYEGDWVGSMTLEIISRENDNTALDSAFCVEQLADNPVSLVMPTIVVMT